MSNSEFSKRRINDNFYTRLVNLYKTGKYSNFLKASEKFMSYCDNGKKILLMRAKAYRELEMYNEALNELSKAIKYKDNEYAMLELYLLYYHLNMYNEALELLPMLYGKEGIKGHSLAISELVMKKQLGMYCNFKMGDRCDMLKSQIQNYDSNLALEHISDHISSNEDNNQVYFNKNIDLEYLFNIIRNQIDNKNKANKRDMLEVHYFSVSNIGSSAGDLYNFIKVVVVPNTNDIITMYPTNDVDAKHITVLKYEYDKLFKDKISTNKKSQIDKFYSKYKI